MDDDVKKLKEIGNIAQSKLDDNGFGGILELQSQVLNSGYPNYIGCRIPVRLGINVQFFRDNLTDYDDKLICDLLENGAPIGFEGENCSIGSVANHKGARELEDSVWKYLNKEASYGAIVGPFDRNPFSCNFTVFPLNTMPKKGYVREMSHFRFKLSRG